MVQRDTRRDINHAIRYHTTRTKQLYILHLRTELIETGHALVDFTNALIRSIFGLGVVTFSTLAEICIKSQKHWIRNGAKAKVEVI